MTSKLMNKFPIPENFPDILHDFAKEVVREQPKDMLDFAVEYFKALELGVPFQYGNITDKSICNETNDIATNPNTKTTTFCLKKEERNKEDENDHNEVIVENTNEKNVESTPSEEPKKEEEASQKSFEEETNKNESEPKKDESSEETKENKVKDFISDVFKQSMIIVSESQKIEKIYEPEKTEEDQAKEFIDDIMKRSQEEVEHLISNASNQPE